MALTLRLAALLLVKAMNRKQGRSSIPMLVSARPPATWY